MKFLVSLASLIFMTTAAADVPYSPTADDELPAAILGNAGPLLGTDTAYYSTNAKTVGYLAVPDSEGPHGAIILIHEWGGIFDVDAETGRQRRLRRLHPR